MVHDFLHDEALEGQDKVLARYLKPDLLIVDDMGMKNLPISINTMLIHRCRRSCGIGIIRTSTAR